MIVERIINQKNTDMGKIQGDGCFKANEANMDLTNDNTIASLLPPLIEQMDKLPLEEIRKRALECVNCKDIHGSESVRKKWNGIFSTERSKMKIMYQITNFYLAAANLKVPSNSIS